jgi:hypothetical protein
MALWNQTEVRKELSFRSLQDGADESCEDNEKSEALIKVRT